MAKRSLKRDLLTGRWKWVTRGVAAILALGLLALLVNSLWGEDIRVRGILSDFDERIEAGGADAEKAREEIRKLGIPYRDELVEAMLGGGRPFLAQRELCAVLHDRPFHAVRYILKALDAEDPLVSHAALTVLLERRAGTPPKAMPDQLLAALEEWCEDPIDPFLFIGIQLSGRYLDPRLVDVLLPLLKARSQDHSSELLDIGRANKIREMVAQVLKRYVSDPRVIEVYLDVVQRDRESDRVQFRIWKAMASKGYKARPEIYWIGARSQDPFTRQTVAEHLERVHHPGVLPILEHLLEDPLEVVRRGAVDSLIAKKSPILIDEIYYLAEDSYSSIKGDLATAVGVYGSEDLIPFLVWCLDDADPIVVEKTVVELHRLTGKHHGFDDAQWAAYRWNRPLAPGSTGRPALIKAFMDDEERVEKALAKWTEEHPPRYRDRDRVPHLIRQLGHADRDNVKQAIRNLVRITGRTEGFPEALLDPAAEVQAEADAMYLFMKEEREEVIKAWKAWLPEWEKGDDREPR